MQVSPIVKNESLMTWQKVEQNQQKGCIVFFIIHIHMWLQTNWQTGVVTITHAIANVTFAWIFHVLKS
jgi:hypothetical protein